MMEFQPFIEDLRTRAGLGTYEEAVGAAEATLETLGEVLDDNSRQDVAQDLPDDLASALRRSQPGQRLQHDEFYERVRERERASQGLAMEHAQAVCQALAQSLDSEQRSKLRGMVPEDYRYLFEPPSTSEPVESQGQPKTGRKGDRVRGRGRPTNSAGPIELGDTEATRKRIDERPSPTPEPSEQRRDQSNQDGEQRRD